jgi:uncharacterized protein YndB with AHSA1/START domain
MKTVTVTRTLNAPIEQVFDVIADHANYKQFPGIRDSKLVREGRTEKNGVGAVREIDAGKAWFQEEITAYERPRRLDYLIVKSRPPLKHEGGSVRLEPDGPDGARCKVTWTTTVGVNLPLIGGLLDKVLMPQLERGLVGTLKSIEKRLALKRAA